MNKTATLLLLLLSLKSLADSTAVINSESTESLKNDSTITTDTTAIVDTTNVDSLYKDSTTSIIETTTKETRDTSISDWRKQSFNIGIGWEIGKEPLLIKWNSYNENISEYYRNIFAEDSIKASLNITETPPEYNVIFPIRVSFSIPVKKDFRLTPLLTYSGVKRTYKSELFYTTTDTISIDSLDTLTTKTEHNLWKCKRKQSLRELSIGFKVSKFISDKYFIINGVEDVTINVGATVSPLISLMSETEMTDSSNNKTTHNFNAFGLGANWEVGLSTYKTTPGNNGIEIGISYHGGWRGHFMKDGLISGSHISYSDIAGGVTAVAKTGSPDYFTHKLLIYADLIFSKKSKVEKSKEKEDYQNDEEQN